MIDTTQDDQAVAKGYAAFDPEAGLLVSSCAPTEAEVGVNLSMIEMSDEQMARLLVVPVTISCATETPHD